jgi:hypothetical protein
LRGMHWCNALLKPPLRHAGAQRFRQPRAPDAIRTASLQGPARRRRSVLPQAEPIKAQTDFRFVAEVLPC